jgi:acyl-CoA reductase-like NAD-dependent aldehyde dehydrogenase
VADLKNFVNGEYVTAAAGRTSEVVDPSTGEAYALAPVSGPEDVDAALRSAETARETWRDATPAQRSLALLKIADAVEERAADLVEAECRNTGKPAALTMAEELPRAWTSSGSSPVPRASCRAPRRASTWPGTPRWSGVSRWASAPR